MDYEAPAGFDGVTPAPEVELGLTPTDGDSQVYQPPAEDGFLGVIDPDLGFGGSVGPRCISQLVVEVGDGTLGPDPKVTVEAERDGEFMELYEVGVITTSGLVVARAPFIVPQGAVIRIFGVDAGSEPCRVRMTSSLPADVCQLEAVLGLGSGGETCLCPPSFAWIILAVNGIPVPPPLEGAGQYRSIFVADGDEVDGIIIAYGLELDATLEFPGAPILPFPIPPATFTVDLIDLLITPDEGATAGSIQFKVRINGPVGDTGHGLAYVSPKGCRSIIGDFSRPLGP